MSNAELAMFLQNALMAHPGAGDIPVQASVLTLVIDALRRSSGEPRPPVFGTKPVAVFNTQETPFERQCPQEDSK